jgi:hypothetical protein
MTGKESGGKGTFGLGLRGKKRLEGGGRRGRVVGVWGDEDELKVKS